MDSEKGIKAGISSTPVILCDGLNRRKCRKHRRDEGCRLWIFRESYRKRKGVEIPPSAREGRRARSCGHAGRNMVFVENVNENLGKLRV
jgi:hypothetical protein